MSEFSENRYESREDVLMIVSDYEDESGKHPTVEVNKNAPGLFLFDIDGTLIDARKIHGPAVVALYKEKFNLPGLEDEEFRKRFTQFYFDHFGKGEREEQTDLCQEFGINFSSPEEKERILDELVEEYGQKFEEALATASPEEKTKMILPGVEKFLERMSKDRIPAAVVTGNVNQSAKAIIKHFGWAKYFIAGGHDDDPSVTSEGYRRANIVKSAVEKCKAKGVDIPPEKMAVFGDTPKDYLATLHHLDGKPFVFLVATGDHRFHDLTRVKHPDEEKRPYLVLPKLSDLKADVFFESLKKE